MGKSMCGYKTPETDSAVDIFTTQSTLHINNTSTERKTGRVAPELSCCALIYWCLWFILATIILTVTCFISWNKDLLLEIAWIFQAVPYTLVNSKLTPFSDDEDDTLVVSVILKCLWFTWIGGAIAVIVHTTEFLTRLFSLFLPTLILVLLVPCQPIICAFIRLCRKKATTGQCKPTEIQSETVFS